MERITNPTPLGFGTLRVMGMIRRRGYDSGFTLISGSDSKEEEEGEEDALDESHVALASPTAVADSPPPAAVPMDTETEAPPLELEQLSTRA